MGIIEYAVDHKLEVVLYVGLLFLSYKLILWTQRLIFHPLSHIPGPKLCAATNLYEFYYDSVCHGRLWAQLPRLHEKYGPIIRLGTNEVHISDSTFFDTLFGFNDLKKNAMTAKQFGISHALFGTEDVKTYQRKRAAFGDAFSRSKALKLKDMIDEHIDKACVMIKDKGSKGEVVDLAFIFRATPAEIATQFLFGEDYGFLEDEETTSSLNDKTFDTLFGLTNLGRFIPFWIPMLMILLRQQIKKIIGLKEPGAAMMGYFSFAQELVKKTEQKHKEGSASELNHPVMFEVFLNHKNLADHEKKPRALAEHAMTIWSGGWDTVGFSLTVGTYAVLRNQQVLSRLQKELVEAWPNPDMHPEMAVFDNLPYLNAVIKETFRLAPGALARITRVNPTEPTSFQNHTIPAGTLMSMSIPMVNNDPSIWGADHAVFRPERWLEPNAEGLDRYLTTFSKGTRICPGIELAWVEFRLIMGTLFRRFDMEIPETVRLTNEEVYPYYECFTPMAKSKRHRLPVLAVSKR